MSLESWWVYVVVFLSVERYFCSIAHEKFNMKSICFVIKGRIVCMSVTVFKD